MLGFFFTLCSRAHGGILRERRGAIKEPIFVCTPIEDEVGPRNLVNMDLATCSPMPHGDEWTMIRAGT